MKPITSVVKAFYSTLKNKFNIIFTFNVYKYKIKQYLQFILKIPCKYCFFIMSHKYKNQINNYTMTYNSHMLRCNNITLNYHMPHIAIPFLEGYFYRTDHHQLLLFDQPMLRLRLNDV